MDSYNKKQGHHQLQIMETISIDNVGTGLPKPANTAAEWDAQLSTYAADAPGFESDDKQDSESPIFDSYYGAGGSETILEMINFSPRKCNAVWDILFNHVTKESNIGRGYKSSFKGKDMIFLLLKVLQNGKEQKF